MNIKTKYGENYMILAGLRQYIEKGTMLASVNYYRDSFQNFKEFEIIEKRAEILDIKPEFKSDDFVHSFILEDFPDFDEEISDDIISVALTLIENSEGKESAELTKEFLLFYAMRIAQASKEDYLAFIGIKDAVSDDEERFIEKVKSLFPVF